MNRVCSACSNLLPPGDNSQIYCSLACQIKHDPIDNSLTDVDLEVVCGGMNYQKFSEWRARILNESS